MKRSFLILITVAMVTSCSKDDYSIYDVSFPLEKFLNGNGISMLNPNVCDSITDAIILPVNWTREDCDKYDLLPAETFQAISTCGLLETLLEHPKNRMVGPWCITCNDMFAPGVSLFNAELQMNKAAVELFRRSDCFSVLLSKYLTISKGVTIVKDGIGLTIENTNGPFKIDYFGMLLASDLSMEALNENEKVGLMALTLTKEIAGDNNYLYGYLPIAIAIMRSCNFAPFMKNVNDKIVEASIGYVNPPMDDIIKYAKIFLREKS